jgi:hypothetical protein
MVCCAVCCAVGFAVLCPVCSCLLVGVCSWLLHGLSACLCGLFIFLKKKYKKRTKRNKAPPVRKHVCPFTAGGNIVSLQFEPSLGTAGVRVQYSKQYGTAGTS